jgi:hypothetical protein
MGIRLLSTSQQMTHPIWSVILIPQSRDQNDRAWDPDRAQQNKYLRQRSSERPIMRMI